MSKNPHSSPLWPCVMYSLVQSCLLASTTHEQLIAFSSDHDGTNGTVR